MSDERFVVSTNEIGEIIVTDVETGKVYHYGNMSNFLGLIRLMNEQEQKIQKLESENDNMNLFIKQTIEPLLFNCVFELNTIESMSQVELANKIEDEIIPFIQDFKYLKYESPEEEKQDKIIIGDSDE